MLTYIYFVKCPNCEDEHFDFFDDAQEYALSCMSKKPIITQTEVTRNDFGECTDYCDLGTIWSWEDVMKEIDEEPTAAVFTKDDLKCMADGNDPEFENIDNSLDTFDSFDNQVVDPTELAESTVNKFVIVGEDEDYSKHYYNADSKNWVTKVSDATLFDDRNSAVDIWYDLDKSDFYSTNIMIKPVHLNECGATDTTNPRKPILDSSRKLGTPIFEDEQVLATNKKGDFLIPASSGYGYTVFNRSNVRIGHIDSETDEDAIRRFNLGDLDEACEKRPLPEGMTIEQLIEEMEENEDTVECVCCNELYPKEECKHDEKHGWICPDCQDEVVECTWCEELYDKSECRYEVDLGWLCSRCEAAIKSRGETLTFREGNYWDFLDEEVKELHDLGNTYDGGYPGTEEDPGLLVDDPKEPASNVEKLEEADEYRKRLTTCTECGAQSYDAETRFCLKCGFN